MPRFDLAALQALSPDELDLISKLGEQVLLESRLHDYRPYPKQRDFHAAGATYRERLLQAANQVGKTLSAGFEVAMHLTGLYPGWWQGKRFDRPTVGWAAGITGESTRDNPQRILLGRPMAHGTGTIPKDCIIEAKRSAHGVEDSMDHIKVRHVSGGTSVVSFKSYEKGREKWQGETLDWVWFDEEPPEDIYTEGLTRTNATMGPVFLTFTPLLGMSNVVMKFAADKGQVTRHTTIMTLDDAEHYTPEQRLAIIESYPEHERDARSKGIPILGSGRIFPVPEDRISESGLLIPAHWPRICGLDFGWDHPAAAVWMAWDRDADVVHVYDCYRIRESTPAMQSPSIRGRGHWIPIAWPHDGLNHEKGSGESLAALYRKEGLNMLAVRATFEDGTNSVERGVLDMLTRMNKGQLKVAAHLNDWWEEFRMYHRQDGKIVKLRDDLMSATRYGMMMLRLAAVEVEPVVHEQQVIGSDAGAWMS